MAVSAGAAEVLRTWGYRGPICELPHGVDPQLLAPHDCSDLLQRLEITRPVIGYAGRIEPEKGVWDLLGAVEILHKRVGSRFSVMMVGDGPGRWKLAAAAASSLPPGVFCFTGSVAHHAIGDYLSAMDIFVLPSRTQRHWKEQFGRVLVEALACGVPLVGSDSGNIPALIEDTGGGLVFQEGNVEDLAQKLQRLLENPQEARALADRGRKTVLERYAYPQIAAALHEALKAALAAPPRGA
jgi:glycosyltransferase involved in cell wall biosynthesis